jgi:hypothetical protein
VPASPGACSRSAREACAFSSEVSSRSQTGSPDSRKLIGRGEHAGPVGMQRDRQLGQLRGENLVARLGLVVRRDRGLVAEPFRLEDALVAAVDVPAFMRPFELCITCCDATTTAPFACGRPNPGAGGARL